MEEKAETRRRDEEMLITLAYFQVKLIGQMFSGKRLPSLDSLLGHKKAQRQMSDDEMWAEIKKLNAAKGGTVNGRGC